MYPFNGVGDFLRFPPLSPAARARLAWFVAQCQLRGSYDELEHVPLERWLRRHCGNEVVDRVWKPLLDSRFDGDYDELPATYLWARTNRMRSARSRGQSGEVMGCLRGGHERLVEAATRRAADLGADLRYGVAVEQLELGPEGEVAGVRVDGELMPFDLTIATLQPPALRSCTRSSMPTRGATWASSA
jgi:protoporphyrinogen oxidase